MTLAERSAVRSQGLWPQRNATAGGREPRRRREAGSLSGSTGRPPPPPPHLRPLRGTAGMGSSGTEIRHGRLLPGTREGGAAGART